MENAILVKGSSVIKKIGNVNYNKMLKYLITIYYQDRVLFDVNDVINIIGIGNFEKKFTDKDLICFSKELIDTQKFLKSISYN
jgi:hypothetical protein